MAAKFTNPTFVLFMKLVQILGFIIYFSVGLSVLLYSQPLQVSSVSKIFHSSSPPSPLLLPSMVTSIANPISTSNISLEPLLPSPTLQAPLFKSQVSLSPMATLASTRDSSFHITSSDSNQSWVKKFFTDMKPIIDNLKNKWSLSGPHDDDDDYDEYYDYDDYDDYDDDYDDDNYYDYDDDDYDYDDDYYDHEQNEDTDFDDWKHSSRFQIDQFIDYLVGKGFELNDLQLLYEADYKDLDDKVNQIYKESQSRLHQQNGLLEKNHIQNDRNLDPPNDPKNENELLHQHKDELFVNVNEPEFRNDSNHLSFAYLALLIYLVSFSLLY